MKNKRKAKREMKGIIICQENNGETDVLASAAYRQCSEYISKNNIPFAGVMALTKKNTSLLSRDTLYFVSYPKTAPHAIIVADLSHIGMPEKEDLFLPLVKNGLLEIHQAKVGICLSKKSPPEQFERGAFNALEARLLCENSLKCPGNPTAQAFAENNM